MTTPSRHLRLVSIAALLSLFATSCMENDEPEPIEGPEAIAPKLYRVDALSCLDCKLLNLHYQTGSPEIELRALDRHGNFVGHEIAMLSPSSAEELDMWLDGLAEGEISLGTLPQNAPYDGVCVELWLPHLSHLSLAYKQQYPPSGLIELDRLLEGLVHDLSNCRTSLDIVDLAPDCEVLADFPG